MLRALYPIRNGSRAEERELELSGHLGSRPVRVGNGAAGQLQLDVYGELLRSLRYFEHTGGKIDRGWKQIIERLADECLQRWPEPDHGIWEEREKRQYTYGKIMAWVALEEAGWFLPKRRDETRRACARIHEDVLRSGVRSLAGTPVLMEAFDSDEVDASALLAFTTGFLPAEIAKSTRETVEERLAEGPFLYRNQRCRAAGEGAFVLCSFWWVNHLIREGKLDVAEELIEALLSESNDVGLFAEEYDPETRSFLGNFPQAYSHLGLIAAVLNLDQARRRPRLRDLRDDEKFIRTVGRTVGIRGVLAGFARVPATARLLFRSRSKWQLHR